jgi:hypothetical protein
VSPARERLSRFGAFASQFVDKRFLITTLVISFVFALGFWVVQDRDLASLPAYLTIIPLFQWIWFIGAYIATHCGTLLSQRSSWKSLTQWAPLTFLLAYIAGTYALFSSQSFYSLVEQ